jgi:hypothetical protein
MAPPTTAPIFPNGNTTQTEAGSEESDDITIREESLDYSQDRRDNDLEEDEECNRTKADVDDLQNNERQTRRGRPLVPPARFRDFTME